MARTGAPGERLLPTYRFEEEAAGRGACRIAGVDEAGRGPLAGPVVAAAVVMRSQDVITEVNDSKLLTASVREKLFHQIMKRAGAVGVGIIPPQTIDEINVLQATRVAMLRAVEQIQPPPDYLLVDGTIKLDIQVPQQAIIKGDRLSFSIAAAGIVAKVTRDEIMRELHERFPLYGFDQHKGYATREHREALAKYGPCAVHRRCFRGVVNPEPDAYPLFSTQEKT
ncbi:MAG TPA: ribonuclease HII [Desulfomonilaceae bacterium]|nr:ribonuclease HII [Desulfomonilaceae bacterium]